MSELKKSALAACWRALGELGFRRVRGSLVRVGEGDAEGLVGLVVGTRKLPSTLLISPIVGVRFGRLDEAMRLLLDDLPKAAFSMVSTPLGYLMPAKSYIEWEFAHGGDHKKSAAEISHAVSIYGLPYIEEHSNWERFSRDVETQGFLPDVDRLRTAPIVMAINGEGGRALDFVQREVNSRAERDDVYSISYRSFARKLADYVENGLLSG